MSFNTSCYPVLVTVQNGVKYPHYFSSSVSKIYNAQTSSMLSTGKEQIISQNHIIMLMKLTGLAVVQIVGPMTSS